MERIFLSKENEVGVLKDPKYFHKLDLVVVRINGRGEMCNARPCYDCLCMMKQVGIRRVRYSVSEDKILTEVVDNMISIQFSTLNYLPEKRASNNKNKLEFLKNILVRVFPKYIFEKNLKYFLEYNMINVFPDFTICINKKKGTLSIYDEKTKLLLSSVLMV